LLRQHLKFTTGFLKAARDFQNKASLHCQILFSQNSGKFREFPGEIHLKPSRTWRALQVGTDFRQKNGFTLPPIEMPHHTFVRQCLRIPRNGGHGSMLMADSVLRPTENFPKIWDSADGKFSRVFHCLAEFFSKKE
jgi:hypothetical protein